MDESAGQKVATIKVDPQDRLRARDKRGMESRAVKCNPHPRSTDPLHITALMGDRNLVGGVWFVTRFG